MKLKLLWPVDPDFEISSPFGIERTTVIDEKKITRVHSGIDIATPEGSPVYAMAPGVIIRAGWEDERDKKKGYGLRVIQQFMYEMKLYYAYYAHLQDALVQEKDRIGAGELIARTGNTGRSSAPHIHVGGRGHDTGQWFDIEFYKENKNAGPSYT